MFCDYSVVVLIVLCLFCVCSHVLWLFCCCSHVLCLFFCCSHCFVAVLCLFSFFAKDLTNDYDMDIDYRIIGQGMAKYKEEDPFVARIIATKQ